jgi:hypothetical protein
VLPGVRSSIEALLDDASDLRFTLRFTTIVWPKTATLRIQIQKVRYTFFIVELL